MFFCKSEKRQPVVSSHTKKDGFQKKGLSHSTTLLQQSSDKRDA